MLLREHPFSFLRHLFLCRSYNQKSHPNGWLFWFSALVASPGKTKRFAGRTPIFGRGGRGLFLLGL